MRCLPQCLTLSFLFATSATFAFAESQNLSDAQRMDLAGPVKSVSVTATKTDVAWQQPSGPTLVLPVWCWECEFDPDGNQTKSGQIFNGGFHGEIIGLVRDANGHVTNRFFTDPSTGETTRDEVVGPFGPTEQTSYQHDQLLSQTVVRYDQFGHILESQTLDAAGNQISRAEVHVDKEGNNKEEWDWGKEGELTLRFQKTFDPQTQFEHFNSFNSFGSLVLTWTVIHGRLASFCELPDSPSQFGDGFTEDINENTVETYDCHGNNKCDISRVHFEYLDPKRRNPSSIEWRDAAGNLQYAAYYEFEIDAFRNWTHRQIWVWSPALGERKLCETDSRSITYWPQ